MWGRYGDGPLVGRHSWFFPSEGVSDFEYLLVITALLMRPTGIDRPFCKFVVDGNFNKGDAGLSHFGIRPGEVVNRSVVGFVFCSFPAD
jgi:hypothetical protein